MPLNRNGSVGILDRSAKLPIYEQLYLELKRRIHAGYYEKRQFPSRQQVCEEFDISAISVKRALKRLHQEAFISMSPGRNTIVQPLNQKFKLNSNLDTLLTDINLNDLTTSVSTIGHERSVIEADICMILDCDSTTLVDQTTRLRRLDGAPFSLVRVIVPLHIATVFGPGRFEEPISSSLLRKYGFELSDVNERISACIASRDVSKVLEIPDGAPVLKIVRTFLANGKDAIFCTVGYYRSDKYEYGGRRALPASWQGV